MKQARTIRWNLTANASRPNPQSSYHYGSILITITVLLANSNATVGGNLWYAVEKGSHVNPHTSSKLVDYFNIPGVFKLDLIKPTPLQGLLLLLYSVLHCMIMLNLSSRTTKSLFNRGILMVMIIGVSVSIFLVNDKEY